MQREQISRSSIFVVPSRSVHDALDISLYSTWLYPRKPRINTLYWFKTSPIFSNVQDCGKRGYSFRITFRDYKEYGRAYNKPWVLNIRNTTQKSRDYIIWGIAITHVLCKVMRVHLWSFWIFILLEKEIPKFDLPQPQTPRKEASLKIFNDTRMATPGIPQGINIVQLKAASTRSANMC